jgi:hypothetical protein
MIIYMCSQSYGTPLACLTVYFETPSLYAVNMYQMPTWKRISV